MRCARIAFGMVVLAAVFSACAQHRTPQKAPQSSPPDTSVVTPTNDADRQRLAIIQQTRDIDICALYGQAREVDRRALSIDAPTSPIMCQARIGDDSDRIASHIGLVVGPPVLPAAPSWARHTTIDGTEITVASALDQPNMPREQLVSASCQFAATFPGSVRLDVMVSAPPRIDGCAIGTT